MKPSFAGAYSKFQKSRPNPLSERFSSNCPNWWLVTARAKGKTHSDASAARVRPSRSLSRGPSIAGRPATVLRRGSWLHHFSSESSSTSGSLTCTSRRNVRASDPPSPRAPPRAFPCPRLQSYWRRTLRSAETLSHSKASCCGQRSRDGPRRRTDPYRPPTGAIPCRAFCSSGPAGPCTRSRSVACLAELYFTLIRFEFSDWAVAIAVDPPSRKDLDSIAQFPAYSLGSRANRERRAARDRFV